MIGVEKRALEKYQQLLERMSKQELVSALLDDAENFFLDEVVEKYGGEQK